jgi:uncharacterized phage protein (TIGR01671 family)
MREIKFRAWCIERKTMVYYDPLLPYGVTDEYWVGEIMQYTGLKDRYGKEIYEGDVIKGNHKRPFVVISMFGGLSLLCVDYYGSGFNNGLVAEPTNDAQVAGWIQESEVLGNLYENPELIKDEG